MANADWVNAKIWTLDQPMASLVVWGLRQFTIFPASIKTRIFNSDPIIIYADQLTDENERAWRVDHQIWREAWQKNFQFPDLRQLPTSAFVGVVDFGGMARIEQAYRNLSMRDHLTDDWGEDGKWVVRWRNPRRFESAYSHERPSHEISHVPGDLSELLIRPSIPGVPPAVR